MSTRWLRVFVCLLCISLGACGGERNSSPPPKAIEAESDYGSGPSPASSPAPAAKSYRSSQDSASESAGGAVESRAPAPAAEPMAPPPRERPGLGTEWGETRVSRVRDVHFTRADGSRPFAMATLNYNDRHGVDALAAHVAHRSWGRDYVTGGGAITVSIQDEDGDPLEAVKLGDRTLVVGHPGDRYSIVLTNHTDHRFEAVATVDGLDVINGRPGTLENRGYVLMPFATLTIDGFRQSSNVVAAFRFASVADSYASKTGSARNVGVIGVAFFAEAGDTFVPYDGRELYLRDTAIPFPAADPRYARPPSR
ncbi:hypothetical protein LVJ94_11585 [Pendulispora rubella]|uniref:Uncharacterized protein n=1 Tax=Pendulispora rubella TaxID=2741070 RepID=A0ABZ2LFA8_9BACT